MGLPSIVTDINGCNEIIQSDVNGIIIPVKDIQAVFNAMEKIQKDEKSQKKSQINSREMIVTRYGQNQVWEAILNEYQSLLKNQNKIL
jgi:glycosyltransferase involved in cell wall biosynthesis